MDPLSSINQFHHKIDDYLRSFKQGQLLEEQLTQCRDLIVRTPLAVTEAQLQRLMALKPSEDPSNPTNAKVLAILGEIFNFVSAQTQEKLLTSVGLDGISHLTSLNLNHHSKVTDEVLIAIAAKPRSLWELHIEGCDEVTDKGVIALANGDMKSLFQLEIGWCTKITDVGLTAIANTKSPIQILSIAGCKSITDIGVKAVVNNLLRMTVLDVSFCNQVTAAGFKEITNLYDMVRLYLSGCEAITDEVVTLIARELPGLIDLDVSGCPQITDQGAKMIRQWLHRLQKLNISECNLITATMVNKLQKSRFFLYSGLRSKGT